MLQVYRGDSEKSLSTNMLINFVKNANINEGILYTRYAIIGMSENKSSLDALLLSSEHGIIVFDIIEEAEVSDRSHFRDNLYNITLKRLIGYKELIAKRGQLKPNLTVLTFAPAWPNQGQQDSIIITQDDFNHFINTSKQVDLTADDYKKLIHSISSNNEVETEASKGKKATKRKYIAISSGILVILLWITLFTIGLLVNSSYYRAAISYSYPDWIDWVWSIISFTLSNVMLLAFLAGFLGGICSKIISTEGFILNRKELTSKNVAYVLYEDPFISAFRGIFLFLAVLALQYFTSFSDLGSVNKNDSEKQTIENRPNSLLYIALLDSVKDSISKEKIKTVWKGREDTIKLSDQDSLVNKLFLYKDSIELFDKPSQQEDLEKKDRWKEKIKSLRRLIRPPPISDIPGITSSSYFKFAIIVSLLAFICGYDPRMFSTFLSNLPFLHKKDNEKKKQNL